MKTTPFSNGGKKDKNNKKWGIPPKILEICVEY
jgi:hypothetical protein